VTTLCVLTVRYRVSHAIRGVMIADGTENYYYFFISTASGFVRGGSGTTIRHITQNNTPQSNKTHHTK
jgi:hypothetical protein